jgi:hypothetical protein
MDAVQTTSYRFYLENPMGERDKDVLRVNFDPKLKLEFHGTKITSDAGLPAYRELDNAFGLTDMVAFELMDNRTGKNTQHSPTALLRQTILTGPERISPKWQIRD